MRILVVGGYGLIGSYVIAELFARGHEVIGAGRDIRGANRRFPLASWVKVDLRTTDVHEWARQLEGVDAVVNCAGALQAGPRDDMNAVHVTGLVTLAKALDGRRLVHVSAAGVASSPGDFGRTKLAGEQALRASATDWVIIRPGLVLAPNAFGGSALLRGLAAFPYVIPAVFADSRIQIVAAGEVAQVVARMLEPGAPKHVAFDLVSDEPYPLAHILVRIRAWLGLNPAPVVVLPRAFAQLGSLIADALGWLGWRSPMRSAAVAQLRHGVLGDPAAARRLIRLSVRSLDSLLAQAPSGVQDRWFARLYFLKPLGLAVLAIFWLTSGLIGLMAGAAAHGVLAPAGFPPQLASAVVLAGSIADIVLGVLVCHRRTARAALGGMVLVSAAYLAGASFWRADLWLDPLGPLVKVVPAMILALLMLAMLDER